MDTGEHIENIPEIKHTGRTDWTGFWRASYNRETRSIWLGNLYGDYFIVYALGNGAN